MDQLILDVIMYSLWQLQWNSGRVENCNRDQMTCKPKIFIICPFKKLVSNPLLENCGMQNLRLLPRPPKSMSAVQQDPQVIHIQDKV